jgi:hypothetical protein
VQEYGVLRVPHPRKANGFYWSSSARPSSLVGVSANHHQRTQHSYEVCDRRTNAEGTLSVSLAEEI